MRPISAEASRGYSHLTSGTSKGSFTPFLQLKKFPDIPVCTPEEARESRPHPEEPRFRLLARRRDPFPACSGQNSRRSRRNSRGGALDKKGRGTPGWCHHSLSPPDVSVHSRKTFFTCPASTFKLRIDSHQGGTWDSPVGKPRGKASRESHRSLDPREGKRDTAATAQEEIARACPHSRRGLTPLGRLQNYPKINVSTGEESSGSGTDSTQDLRPEHRRLGNPRGPRATRMGTGFS